jgi:Glycogen recognition site of AMP-activated protein kinase
MKMGPVFFLAALPVVLHAQTQASLGVGVGTVRYAGGSTFSAGTVSPALQFLSPSSYLGANGSLSALKDGVWAAQGRVDLWMAFPRGRASGPRFALSVNLATSTRSDGDAAGAGTLIAELLWAEGHGGVAIGAGPGTGVIEGEPGIGAPHMRARSWWLSGPTQLSLTVEPVRFIGAWYTDIVSGATFDRGRVVGSVWANARISSAYGSKGAASAAVQYFVSPSVAIEGAAGSYLSDPFQGLPRAGFVSAGLRVHAARRAIAPEPALPARLAPLVAQRRGDSVVVRFHMAGAHSVAIAGDWNAWQPAPLHALGGEIWEGAMVLVPGTYHFNLLVDGSEWVVPGGVAVVSDGMGGLVAVLTVL